MDEEVQVFDIIFQVGIGNLLMDYGFNINPNTVEGGRLGMWLDRDTGREVIAYCDGRVFAAFPSETVLTVEWNGVAKSASFTIVNQKLSRKEVEVPKHYNAKPFADITREAMAKLVKQLKDGKPHRVSTTQVRN